jgi:hypothetical protein
MPSHRDNRRPQLGGSHQLPRRRPPPARWLTDWTGACLGLGIILGLSLAIVLGLAIVPGLGVVIVAGLVPAGTLLTVRRSSDCPSGNLILAARRDAGQHDVRIRQAVLVHQRIKRGSAIRNGCRYHSWRISNYWAGARRNLINYQVDMTKPALELGFEGLLDCLRSEAGGADA